MDSHRRDSAPEAACLSDLLTTQAARMPDATAIVAPARGPLTYARLCAHIDAIGARLNALGLGRGDRIALALPNGPEMATAFLAVAAVATCAPLNPAYRADEFDFYLSDLGARAIILPAGAASPARSIARTRGIPIIELVLETDEPAGVFTLMGDTGLAAKECQVASPDDVALVLHTSGTTARPKIVPLTGRNILLSASHVRDALALTPADRCLNVMPLFHIHGLVAALLASLAAGASAVCTPGFYAPRFFAWVDEFQPTWYTAVPTMHQAILSRAPEHKGIIARRPLRVIRSSSAALAPRVSAQLETAFG
ncbi:MAG: AMP-binding protein, partial [Chloroflexi bacterium]|nr:AMP-binding protein [Chloroflexota bacterium]